MVCMKKRVTIEDLAVMTQNGFSGLKEEMTLKFDGVNEKLDSADKKFDEVEKNFKEVHIHLDRIEKILIRDHDRRIEKVEEDIRVLIILMKQS